ncbi:hypothetical protein [Phormidium sp. CCY1219]|uniref:hypothetical protein n=1 Tax=Phormidium sp. CCY1219 TaxID=2886104 RepID=UPI002D1F1309|nr:hypothetical protein [Phormidium sp. CCY1219]MEB3827185.1 hypothetical protein [Phormidium sp. CCY1219]
MPLSRGCLTEAIAVYTPYCLVKYRASPTSNATEVAAIAIAGDRLSAIFLAYIRSDGTVFVILYTSARLLISLALSAIFLSNSTVSRFPKI